MTNKVQQNIDRIRKLATISAAGTGNESIRSRTDDSLRRAIRNEKEAAIFSAELATVVSLAQKK